MVNPKYIKQQLQKIKFGSGPWNQSEISELPHIIHDGEQISECVNGLYEGGVALLVATEIRVLLIDKKPLRFLNVEDLRFDMINEIDYSHRLLGAAITISTGSKTLHFRSFNQQRLRHLINLVQEQMSRAKKDQSEHATSQKQHLEEINRQLQTYLIAQQQQLERLAKGKDGETMPRPEPQLADYLFAQRLMEDFNGKQTQANGPGPVLAHPVPTQEQAADTAELVARAKEEILSHQQTSAPAPAPHNFTAQHGQVLLNRGLVVSPLQIAYSKLPMLLRNRKFGRPSLRAHSQQTTVSGGYPS